MVEFKGQFLGQGWKFPVRPNGRGGLSYSAEEDNIAESIWIILSTPIGSRIMRPEFGCGIHEFTFAPNNANTVALISQQVHQALVRFEPRIDVLGVAAAADAENPNTLFVNVDYRIRANNALNNIVYPFYISEGVA